MPKFLVDGCLLTCSKGTVPGSLSVLDPRVKGGRSPMANKDDGLPMVNIPCFGLCLGLPGSPPPPCMPGTSSWDTSSKVKVRGSPAINEESSISCPVGGGTIKPAMPGQMDVRNTSGGGGAAVTAVAAVEAQDYAVYPNIEGDKKENEPTDNNASHNEQRGFVGSKGNELNNYNRTKRTKGTTINGRKFSGHAVDRMQERGIPPTAVENTIKTGVEKKITRNGKVTTNYFDKTNNVTVVTNESGGVVTLGFGKIGR